MPTATALFLWFFIVRILEPAQIFTGASEHDLPTNPFLNSRKRETTEVLNPASVAIPALASDVKATHVLDLVLQSDQGLRPTANALVEFAIKISSAEAASNAGD